SIPTIRGMCVLTPRAEARPESISRESALDLLVLRVVLADHAHLALAAHDLAAVAHALDACSDLHRQPSHLHRRRRCVLASRGGLTSAAWIRDLVFAVPMLAHPVTQRAPGRPSEEGRRACRARPNTVPESRNLAKT